MGADGQLQITVTDHREVRADGSKDSPAYTWLDNNSRSFFLIKRLFDKLPHERQIPHDLPCDIIGVHMRNQTPGMAAGWQRTSDLLTVMRQEIEQHGARMVVVPIPMLYNIDPASGDSIAQDFGLAPGDMDWDLSDKQLLDWGRQQQVPILDLFPPFRAAQAAGGPPLYYLFDGHWTTAGHALAARIIREQLSQLGIVAP
jgi:hypothetical protein